MGRPKKDIDKNQFEKLCGLHCTEIEICSFFDVTDKTLNRWCREVYGKGFSDVFKKKRDIGNISIRRNQMELSKKSASMAIWLGKQYLNQTDEISVTSNLKEDDKDALSIAFEELTKNGLTEEDDK
jgi:hypothetical protein